METERWEIDSSHSGIHFQMLETGGVVVGERVELEFDIEAVKQLAAEAA